MARGKPLTVIEKYAIRAMLEEKMPISEIAAKSRRSETAVRKYINEELQPVVDFIENQKEIVPKNVEEALLKRLYEAGVNEFAAHSVVKIMKTKLTTPVTLDNVDQLYRYCINLKTPKDLLVTKSRGGRTGVAIMNEGASGKMDDLRANRSPRDTSGHIFRQEDAE